MKKWASSALAAMVAFAWASVVSACPVCGEAKNEAARVAFVDTTIFMSLFPLAMLGGIAFWGIRKLNQVERAAEKRGGSSGGSR